MRYEHVEDRAALYALGALDADSAVTVEAHLRECPDCAQEVGAAEADVALLASSEAQRAAPDTLFDRVERTLENRRSYWPAMVAVAAAFIVGLLPSAYFLRENATMRDAVVAQSGAIDRLTSAPHRTAIFQTMPDGAQATVAYAPSGSWYVIVVSGVSKSLSVAWMHDGRQTMLGEAIPHGGTAMLYLPKSHRMDRLALVDDGRLVAEAHLY